MKKIGRNDPCWCGSGKKYKVCHEALDEKIARYAREGHIVPRRDMIKTPEQVQKIKESARINVAVLDYIAEQIRPGISTEQINQWVEEKTREMGGIPAPLGFEGYPKSVCTSVNDQVFGFFPNVLYWNGKSRKRKISSGCKRVGRTGIKGSKTMGIYGRYGTGSSAACGSQWIPCRKRNWRSWSWRGIP